MTWIRKTRVSLDPIVLARQLDKMSAVGMTLSKAEWQYPVLISEVVTFEPQADQAIAALLLIEPFGDGPQHLHVIEPVSWVQTISDDGSVREDELTLNDFHGETYELGQIEPYEDRPLKVMETWHEFRNLHPGHWEQIVGGFNLGKRL